jgi:hypothetical protein
LPIDSRKPDGLSIETLQAMDQHRSIGLTEHVFTHLNPVVGSDRNQVSIERGVMQRAQRDPVRDGGGTAFIPISNNVRRFQQLITLQSADRTMALIGFQHSFTELLLMKTLLDDARCVSPANRCLHRLIIDAPQSGEAALVNCDGERQPVAVISNNVDGILGGVAAGNYAVEVDQGNAPALSFPKSRVVVMIGKRGVFRTAVAISKEAVFAKGIVVRALLTLKGRNGRDADR